ncbi:6530_t:CDS:2 [Entrophospora sp. SA101]|nr:6525_t:CDS:2 [Entrophospora sp. SA101]CAJ0631987.1 6530_t:CDS:2 [Entrophospora sp. SA101]
MSPLLQNELFSKWSSASISARHKLLAIRRQEGIEEVKRKGIIIDREVSLGSFVKENQECLPNTEPQPSQASQFNRKPYPTLVVEIGDTKSDGYVALLALLYLRNKLNPTVPVIVKSFGTASLHVSTQNYLQRTVNVPANTITGLGFGAGPCNDANIQDYQIPIPTILFFNGVPGDIPAGVPNNFNIDLWKLQDVNLNSWVRKLTT